MVSIISPIGYESAKLLGWIIVPIVMQLVQLSILLQEERKIGPKGQIVLPKAFRKAKGMIPGDKVVVKLEENGIVIDKSEVKAEEIFEQMAKSIKGKKDWSKVNWHELHEERMREYMKKKGW